MDPVQCCSVCHKEKPLNYPCVKCSMAFYCSKKCRNLDFNAHYECCGGRTDNIPRTVQDCESCMKQTDGRACARCNNRFLFHMVADMKKHGIMEQDIAK